jgi:hypothetical protein
MSRSAGRPAARGRRGLAADLDAGPDLAGVGALRVATAFGEGAVPIAGEVRGCLDGFAARVSECLSPVILSAPGDSTSELLRFL